MAVQSVQVRTNTDSQAYSPPALAFGVQQLGSSPPALGVRPKPWHIARNWKK